MSRSYWGLLALSAVIIAVVLAVVRPGLGSHSSFASDTGITISLDMDTADGPCTDIDATANHAPLSNYTVGVCVSGLYYSPGEFAFPVGVISFNVIYNDVLNTAPEVANAGNGLDDNPDANVGTTFWGDGLGGGWDCSGGGLAYPTGDKDGATGAGHGQAFMSCKSVIGPWTLGDNETSGVLGVISFHANSAGLDTMSITGGLLGYTDATEMSTCNPTVLLSMDCLGGSNGQSAATPTFTPLPPTATFTPTATRTNTPTPVPPTATFTPTPVPATATFTPTPIPPTATFTPTPVPATATYTPTPVPPTATFTPTPVSATATFTPVPPTATFTPTPVPPTATFTATPVPPTPTWTPTPVPPTVTFTPTPVPGTATFTPTPLPPTATFTPTPVPPTATITPTPVPPTPTFTPTPVPPTPTWTPTPVPPTATFTATPVVATATFTPTATRTNTPVPPTATATAGATATPVSWCPDLNSDGKVTGKDVSIVARALFTWPGRPRWNPVADIDDDGRVNLHDLFLVVRGLTSPDCRY